MFVYTLTSIVLRSATTPKGAKQQNMVKSDMKNWSPGGLFDARGFTAIPGCWVSTSGDDELDSIAMLSVG